MAAGDIASSRLLALPLEVLLTIVSHLTTPEYGHLRLTCKHLETSLFSSFSREFFHKRQFMLTEFSLQALVDISRSRLAPSMTHVIISLDRPAPVSLVSPVPLGSEYNPVKINCSRREFMDHLSLVNGGHDVDMMAEAFGNLPNLDAIGLRDFNSRSRYRDGGDWKSYGATKVWRETGLPLNTPARNLRGMWARAGEEDWPVYQSRAFLCILRALDKAGVRPLSFQVILRHLGLDDFAFNLPKFVHVQSVLAELRTLFLDLHEDHVPIAVDSGDGQTHVECPNYALRVFLGHLTELRHLRLNFRAARGYKHADFLSWLARPALPPTVTSQSGNGAPGAMFPEPPLPVDLSHLTELNIGMATVDVAALLGLVRKFRASLQRLEIHRVTLRDTTSGQDNMNKINLWAKFIGQIPKLQTKLTGLALSSVSLEREGKFPFNIDVKFKDSSATRNYIRWAGQDLEGGLKDIINSMSVTWPQEPSDDESIDGGDESDSLADEIESAAESETNEDDAA